jgi:ribosomal protein S9
VEQPLALVVEAKEYDMYQCEWGRYQRTGRCNQTGYCAFAKLNPKTNQDKAASLMTRDAREVERKNGAQGKKRSQFSKR